MSLSQTQKIKRTIERLEKLSEVLNTYDPKNRSIKVNGSRAEFYMNQFLRPVATTDQRAKIIPDFCGSQCCALGAAALHPWFRKRGLVAKPENGMDNSVVYRYGKDKSDNANNFGRHFNEYYAGAEFFGISPRESFWLFGDSYGNLPKHFEDITPLDVDKRVREMIETYRAKLARRETNATG